MQSLWPWISIRGHSQLFKVKTGKRRMLDRKRTMTVCTFVWREYNNFVSVYVQQHFIVIWSVARFLWACCCVHVKYVIYCYLLLGFLRFFLPPLVVLPLFWPVMRSMPADYKHTHQHLCNVSSSLTRLSSSVGCRRWGCVNKLPASLSVFDTLQYLWYIASSLIQVLSDIVYPFFSVFHGFSYLILMCLCVCLFCLCIIAQLLRASVSEQYVPCASCFLVSQHACFKGILWANKINEWMDE